MHVRELSSVSMYFEGIFAPLNKITTFGSLSSPAGRGSLQKLDHGKIPVSHVTAKVDTGDGVNSPVNNNNNNNNKFQENVYGAVIMAQPLREFTWFI